MANGETGKDSQGLQRWILGILASLLVLAIVALITTLSRTRDLATEEDVQMVRDRAEERFDQASAQISSVVTELQSQVAKLSIELATLKAQLSSHISTEPTFRP